jgi:hypothetical protein
MKQDINMLLLQLEKLEVTTTTNFIDSLVDDDLILTTSDNLDRIKSLITKTRPDLKDVVIVNIKRSQFL